MYCKPMHTDQYLRFNSCHPLAHKLGVIRTIQHKADTVAKEAEEHCIKDALSSCGYHSWAFVKAGKMPKECSKLSRREERQPLGIQKPLVIRYVSGESEQLRCIFSNHHCGFQTSKYTTPKNCSTLQIRCPGTCRYDKFMWLSAKKIAFPDV